MDINTININLGETMNGLNISQACEKEWEKTLETASYPKLNNNLS